MNMRRVPGCRALGYQPVEINASDTRNKADSKITGGMGGKLANAVKEMCTNTAIGTDAQGRRKRVLPVPPSPPSTVGHDNEKQSKQSQSADAEALQEFV